ncbi:MAG: hypothetical protein K8R54_07470 [Bacteroidales bacterium]|nr:hypothetical protein [Bacteroidales bacterium]
MKHYILITLLGLISSLYSCSQENKTMKNKTYNAQIEYPYVASEQRTNIIFDNMNKLKFGMNKKDVIQLLTLPDEINATYPSNITAKDTIGFSYVYIIERKQENGSQNEKAEKLIRIHFDTNATLINAYAIKIPEFTGIEKEAINTDNNLPGSKFSIEEAVKKSMIVLISETNEIKYHKPIIAKCIAVEDPVEPGQIIVVTCYYYQKFNVTETISGDINEIFEADYTTDVPVSEDKIIINSSHILFLQESKVEGKYHLIKVLYDTETNRQEIKSSIEKLSDLINN